MIETLLEPFSYDYMIRALWVSVLVGTTCAFLSCYLMLKGLSLMGDALAHSIVPGVALAYLLVLPYAAGAFFTGLLAAFSITLVRQKTNLREDTVIGLVFTAFFAAGLLLVSINPTSINIQSIILGNILTIPDSDAAQVVIISIACLALLSLKWKELVAVFFDEDHARSIGLPVQGLKIMFFTLLSASTVAALQTVGACLVIAMVVTPGATAYLLTDKFGRMVIIAMLLGAITNATGVYFSFFLNASTGGLIVTIQTLLFFTAFLLAPKHGLIRTRALIRQGV